VQTSFQLCTVKAPKNTFQVDTIWLENANIYNVKKTFLIQQNV
jgi:hypothetical protein